MTEHAHWSGRQRPAARWLMILLLVPLLLASIGVGRAQAASWIYCPTDLPYPTTNLQNPHRSSHVHGRINVLAGVKCSQSVNYIVATLRLIENGRVVSTTSCRSNFGESQLLPRNCHTDVYCRSGASYSADLTVQVMYPAGYTPAPATGHDERTPQQIYCTALDSGNSLLPGEELHSPNGNYRLIMQHDGNLVEYGPQGVVWNSCTSVRESMATMQGDGNFVVYTPWHVATFSTNKFVRDTHIEVQDDGNIVNYTEVSAGHIAVWGSMQQGSCQR